MRPKPTLAWRAGFATLLWFFMFGVCIYIWHYIYLLFRDLLCG